MDYDIPKIRKDRIQAFNAYDEGGEEIRVYTVPSRLVGVTGDRLYAGQPGVYFYLGRHADADIFDAEYITDESLPYVYVGQAEEWDERIGQLHRDDIDEWIDRGLMDCVVVFVPTDEELWYDAAGKRLNYVESRLYKEMNGRYNVLNDRAPSGSFPDDVRIRMKLGKTVDMIEAVMNELPGKIFRETGCGLYVKDRGTR